MRKSCLLVLFPFLMHVSVSGQEAVFKIARSYFRSDPFRGEFSAFMNHLLNDPTLTNKTMEKRTDSSLFYFEGTYNSPTYNPFFFKPKRIEVVLTEMEVKLDSLLTDTIFAYELLAYANDTKDGKAEISEEFQKILKHYKNSFSRTQVVENPTGISAKGTTYNFFDRAHAVSPFALSLYGPDDKNEMCLILTLRMDTYNNVAMLAAPFILEPASKSDDQ
jgi:hypothetical protein